MIEMAILPANQKLASALHDVRQSQEASNFYTKLARERKCLKSKESRYTCMTSHLVN